MWGVRLARPVFGCSVEPRVEFRYCKEAGQEASHLCAVVAFCAEELAARDTELYVPSSGRVCCFGVFAEFTCAWEARCMRKDRVGDL